MPRFSIPDDDDGGGSGGERRRPSGDRDAFVGLRRICDEDEPVDGSGGDRGLPCPLPGRRSMSLLLLWWLLGDRGILRGGIGGERGRPRNGGGPL